MTASVAIHASLMPRSWIATAYGLAMTENRYFEVPRPLCGAPAIFPFTNKEMSK
jgi:hypothetical protein